jgi:hypothetical protein
LEGNIESNDGRWVTHFLRNGEREKFERGSLSVQRQGEEEDEQDEEVGREHLTEGR